MGLIETLFTQYGAWTWFAVGIALLAFEIFFPVSISIWFGVSALIVGVLTLVLPGAWQTYFVVWAVLSIAILVAGRAMMRAYGGSSDDPHLNNRAGRLIGRVFTLAEPIGENGGRLTIDDTVWRIRGPHAAVGEKVRIAGVDGSVLVVESAT